MIESGDRGCGRGGARVRTAGGLMRRKRGEVEELDGRGERGRWREFAVEEVEMYSRGWERGTKEGKGSGRRMIREWLEMGSWGGQGSGF